jgi:MFS family permease
VALADLALPFYVGHAQDVLNLPARVIGYFVVAQTVSTVFASLGLAAISERWGPRHVAQIGGAAGAMAPLLALLLHISGPGWIAQLYPIIFVALGVINSTFMLGFFNYLIEIAPDDARPAFVGMSNTVLGLMTLVPILGGWLLNRTSYSVLFTSATLASSLGFLMSLRLPSAEAANAWRATANRSTEEIRRQ